MLVLSRRPGESLTFILPPHLHLPAMQLTVLAVRGAQIKLGIVADPGIAVVRGELLDEVPDEVRERRG